MKFHVYSRGAIEIIKPFPEPHVFISVTSSPEDRAILPETASTIAVLRLVFPDADVPSEVAPLEALFSSSHARLIWHFVLTHKEQVETIVLHCDAGQSRSPGIAAAISKVLVGDDSEFFSRYRPNMRVFRTLLDTWYGEFDGSISRH